MEIGIEDLKLYVVTLPENGWDCVVGAYYSTSKDKLREVLIEDYECPKNEFDSTYVITPITDIKTIV